MKRFLSILLALSIVLGLCACGGMPAAQADTEAEKTENEAEAEELTAPEYPDMAPKPRLEDYLRENGWELDEGYYEAMRAWQEDLWALRDQPEDFAKGLEEYFAGCLTELLGEAGEENRVCSPLNIYMALAMLAEVTDGQSRRQILDLLGAEDLEALRRQAGAIWQSSYQDDGQVKSVLAASLWMNRMLSYKPETLDNLAAYYYASGFRGTMGSPEVDALLQDWINQQTGGLLSGPAAGLHLDPETVLALVSTIYFKAPWTDVFDPKRTEKAVFHSPTGDLELYFMHSGKTRSYYWGEHFAALGLGMENGGAMWLILPDEGLTPEALLGDEEAMRFLLSTDKWTWDKQKDLIVHLSLPKFDVSSDLDLIPALKALGVTDVFDEALSDFSPLTAELDGIYVSKAEHAARVLIDEEGCEAAAYTVLAMAGAGMPPEETVDFVLDRPFLFAVTNARGLPLFVGLVNNPAE